MVFLRNRILVIIFLLCVVIAQGQSDVDSCKIVIQGKVIDAETLEPIPFARILIKNTLKGTYSNADGSYVLEGLCVDEKSLEISCVGYTDTVCNHQHEKAHTHTSTIKLSISSHEINEVVVSVEHKRKEGTESLGEETITKEEISKDATRSVAAVLSEIDGVSFVANGSNVQLPIIHGLYGNRVLMLNNGFKHGFQNWGTDHAPEIDVSNINKITLVKGASGIRYGSEALGGVIITEPNPLHLNEDLELNIGSGFQTNGRGFQESINIGKGYKKTAYYLGGSYTKIGDRHTPDYILTNSGKEEIGLNAGLRLHLKDWDIKNHYSFIKQNLALLRSSVAESGNLLAQSLDASEPLIIKPFSYQIGEPNQLTQHHLLSTEINWWYNDSSKLSLKVGQQINKRQEFDVRRNANLPIIDLTLYTSDVQLSWKHPSWHGLNGVLGTQYFYQNNDNNQGTGTTPFIPNYNTTRTSAFIIEKYAFKKVILEFGIRGDFENNSARGRETSQETFTSDYSFKSFTSSVGFIRKSSSPISFRSNLGIAWRAPNMAELFSFGQHGFKNQFGLLRYYTDDNGDIKTDKVLDFNDAEIKPEQGYKWINEIDFEKKRYHGKITAYVNYIDNYIYQRPIGIFNTIRGVMPFYIIEQADALLAGAEITYHHHLSKHIEGIFGGSYLWSFNAKKGERLINQPPASINAKLSLKTGDFWKITKSKIELESIYTFKQFLAPRTISPQSIIDGSTTIGKNDEIFDFKAAPDGYFLLNISWNYEIGNFTGRFELRNILNKQYRNYLNEMRYFADEMGTNFLVSINYKL